MRFVLFATLFFWASLTAAQTPVADACANGDAKACNNWGYDLEHGHGVEKNMPEALAIYRKACEMAEPFSCTNVGLFLENARAGGEPNPEAAYPFFVQGCDGADPKGCEWAAKLHREVPAFEDPAKATAFVQRGCALDHVNSCIWQGIAFEDGAGVTTDVTMALTSYRKACTLGGGMGCYNAALLSKADKAAALGEDRFATSVELAQRGCELGNLNACNTFGYALDTGRGVARDRAGARAVFEQTCAQDSGLGCSNLSKMLINGDGGPRDRTQGRRLKVRACDLGYKRAC